MFYEEKPDKALRFGDVIQGFVLSAASIDSPFCRGLVADYRIEVSHPPFSVILTPCCSIGDKTLALTPLIAINPSFFDNPYLSADFTNVNRPMTPQQAVSPEIWQKLPDEQKQRRLSFGTELAYAFADSFVYSSHPLLPTYTLKTRAGNQTTGHYMIDFRRIYRIECRKVGNPKQSPWEAKILQLSIDTRDELRLKLAKYYSRIPREDEV